MKFDFSFLPISLMHVDLSLSFQGFVGFIFYLFKIRVIEILVELKTTKS